MYLGLCDGVLEAFAFPHLDKLYSEKHHKYGSVQLAVAGNGFLVTVGEDCRIYLVNKLTGRVIFYTVKIKLLLLRHRIFQVMRFKKSHRVAAKVTLYPFGV